MRVAGAAVAVALLLAQGPTLGPRPLDQLDRAVRRPPPSLPPAPAPTRPRGEQVWVPDRYVDRPEGTYHVPGHWERRIDEQQHYVPPLVVCNNLGGCVHVPAGVRPPPEVRQGP